MSKLQFIGNLSDSDVFDIVKSVDTVLFDVDGVLLLNRNVIPGSDNAVAKLRKLGKKIGFVTNNSMYSIDHIVQNLKSFDATAEEVATPNLSLLAYLKKIDFKRDIYVVGGSVLKKLLRETGYNVIEYKDIQPTELEETFYALKNMLLKAIELCKNVGIVYLDLDLNLQGGSLQVAKCILDHMDGVQLLTGLNDDMAPISEKMNAITSKFYIDMVERLTKKKSIQMAKPGVALGDVIKAMFDISDCSRVMMVGDNVETDIAFGIKGGFKTCLVLTGVTKKEHTDNLQVAEEHKPDYVASSLGEIFERIKDM